MYSWFHVRFVDTIVNQVFSPAGTSRILGKYHIHITLIKVATRLFFTDDLLSSSLASFSDKNRSRKSTESITPKTNKKDEKAT